MPAPPRLSTPSVPPSAALLGRLEHFGVRLGLERMRGLLATLPGGPLATPTVLVGGTNGKGSTASLIEAMARAAGLSTGLYTSPHLEDVRERIRLGGRPVPEPELAADLQEILERAERAGLEPPTYFEILTLAAFVAFRRHEVELAVLEVGLGGRLDATNAAEPLVSVVTSIGLDHQKVLGATLEEIAREKAGIFRPGRPAVVWVDDPGAATAIAESAAAVGARLVPLHRTCRIERRGEEVLLDDGGRQRRFALPLAGVHQARNLALAVRAAEELRDLGFGALDDDAIRRGAAAVRWPGRLEAVELPGGATVILDAAHNPQGIAALAAWLRARGGARPALLFGVLGERDGRAMLGALRPLVSHVVLTRPDSDRAADPAELVDGPAPDLVVEPDPAAALGRALPGPGGALVVAGSIYLLGAVRRELRRRFGVPAPTVGD